MRHLIGYGELMLACLMLWVLSAPGERSVPVALDGITPPREKVTERRGTDMNPLKAAAPAKRRGDLAEAMVKDLEALCREGAGAWRRSCRGKELHGLCLKRNGRADAFGLSPDRLARDPRQVKKALAAYDQVLRLFAKGRIVQKVPEDHPARRALFERILACASEARFMKLEPDFLAYLSFGPPPRLTGDTKDSPQTRESTQRLKTWVENRLRQGLELGRHYFDLVKEVRLPMPPKMHLQGHPRTVVASMVRTAQMYHDFGQALVNAPAPEVLKTPEQKEAFRQQLEEQAQPILEKVRGHLQKVAEVAKQHGIPDSDPWVVLARQALAAMAKP